VKSQAAFQARYDQTAAELRSSGQYKAPRTVSGPMGPIATVDGRPVIVLCSNDYLGLANHPDVVAAGVDGLRTHGAGTASVRFICGTLDLHRDVESAIAGLVGTAAALTFVSCWNANGALFPTVVAAGDTVLSDELNHASIIDSVRQTAGATRSVYRHSDLADLEQQLAAAGQDGVRWVVTDGVFSMEGDLARLPELVELCERYDAMLVVDDSHGIGVLGATGRGVAEHFGLLGRIDVVTGTLGKSLGGAAGGFVGGSEALIDLLVQRGRPSLFSNALPATVASSARAAIDVMQREPERVARLHANAARLREGLRSLGFDCEDAPSAIIPIILGDAHEVQRCSAALFELGVLVVGFSFPVVPKGAARLRVQASAALTDEQIATALDAFGRMKTA
jgi:glycine C-acetyltransferase